MTLEEQIAKAKKDLIELISRAIGPVIKINTSSLPFNYLTAEQIFEQIRNTGIHVMPEKTFDPPLAEKIDLSIDHKKAIRLIRRIARLQRRVAMKEIVWINFNEWEAQGGRT